jgi:AcrR family transcriptional regulator
MTNSDSYQKWIKSAYVLFAQEGPDNISVKALAKECGLPRTNFYYYFANKQELIEKLIEFHFNSTTEVFNKELEKRRKNNPKKAFFTLKPNKLPRKPISMVFL